MILAEDPLAVGEDPLLDHDRLAGAPRPPVGRGKVAARHQGVGMLLAEKSLAVGDHSFPEHDRLCGASRLPV